MLGGCVYSGGRYGVDGGGFGAVLYKYVAILYLLLASYNSLRVSRNSNGRSSSHKGRAAARAAFTSAKRVRSMSALRRMPRCAKRPCIRVGSGRPVFARSRLAASSCRRCDPLSRLKEYRATRTYMNRSLVPARGERDVDDIGPAN